MCLTKSISHFESHTKKNKKKHRVLKIDSHGSVSICASLHHVFHPPQVTLMELNSWVGQKSYFIFLRNEGTFRAVNT